MAYQIGDLVFDFVRCPNPECNELIIVVGGKKARTRCLRCGKARVYAQTEQPKEGEVTNPEDDLPDEFGEHSEN